ncbi:MAG: carbamoyltransferase HypF, partial [Candidatus Hadarchaeales archaeon]
TPGSFQRGELEIETMLKQLETGVNVFRTSSCGRVLDAVSFILGICSKRTYEGEPAMKLEAVGRNGNPRAAGIHPKLRTINGVEVLDTSELILDVLDAVKRGISRADVAAGAQWALADGLAQIAARVAESDGIKPVGVSGGVFCNDLMTAAARERINSEGLKFIMHKEVPPGDGGISLGQVYVAAKTIRR